MNNNNLVDLVKEYSSPCYIFDYDVLQERINRLREYSPSNLQLCYAIKANPFLILGLINENILFEVCSPGELSICEKYHVSPDKIVFSGVCKTYKDIEKAYNLKVKTITLESPLHCDLLIDVINNCKNIEHKQEVILRKTSGNQFGMSDSDIKDCIRKLLKYKNIIIRGIHFFTGTQKNINKILEEVSQITEYCNNLQKELNINFTDIEYGPGLSYNYFTDNSEKNNYSDFIEFVNSIKTSSYKFVIELGRYIASPCGEYITSIKDIKNDGDKRYCIIDGGINHINYYGQMLGMKIPVINHFKNGMSKNIDKYCICGSLCTTADVIIRELELDNPQIDDLLIFNNIGAYSITEGIYLFLSHSMPVVLIRQNNKLKIIRNQIETFVFNS